MQYVKLTGRKLPGSDFDPSLKIAVTYADFQSRGIFPISNDLLKILLSGTAISLLSSLNTLGGIKSGPCALDWFNSCNFSTAAGVIIILL